MYKVNLKTLKEITKTLDGLINSPFISEGFVTNDNHFTEHLKRIKLRKKAAKLSHKIKVEYTKIKK
jgi:hypothetical protein